MLKRSSTLKLLVEPDEPMSAKALYDEAPSSEAEILNQLDQITQRVVDVQKQSLAEFQQLLNALAGTKHETFEDNKKVLDAVLKTRNKLSAAFRHGKRKNGPRVNVTIIRGGGGVVGTFQVFTTTANREYVYGAPEFPQLTAYDPMA